MGMFLLVMTRVPTSQFPVQNKSSLTTLILRLSPLVTKSGGFHSGRIKVGLFIS
jgi:hypothetical protein